MLGSAEDSHVGEMGGDPAGMWVEGRDLGGGSGMWVGAQGHVAQGCRRGLGCGWRSGMWAELRGVSGVQRCGRGSGMWAGPSGAGGCGAQGCEQASGQLLLTVQCSLLCRSCQPVAWRAQREF